MCNSFAEHYKDWWKNNPAKIEDVKLQLVHESREKTGDLMT